jgi:hypothetical protein
VTEQRVTPALIAAGEPGPHRAAADDAARPGV